MNQEKYSSHKRHSKLPSGLGANLGIRRLSLRSILLYFFILGVYAITCISSILHNTAMYNSYHDLVSGESGGSGGGSDDFLEFEVIGQFP